MARKIGVARKKWNRKSSNASLVQAPRSSTEMVSNDFSPRVNGHEYRFIVYIEGDIEAASPNVPK